MALMCDYLEKEEGVLVLRTPWRFEVCLMGSFHYLGVEFIIWKVCGFSPGETVTHMHQTIPQLLRKLWKPVTAAATVQERIHSENQCFSNHEFLAQSRIS